MVAASGDTRRSPRGSICSSSISNKSDLRMSRTDQAFVACASVREGPPSGGVIAVIARCLVDVSLTVRWLVCVGLAVPVLVAAGWGGSSTASSTLTVESPLGPYALFHFASACLLRCAIAWLEAVSTTKTVTSHSWVGRLLGGLEAARGRERLAVDAGPGPGRQRTFPPDARRAVLLNLAPTAQRGSRTHEERQPGLCAPGFRDAALACASVRECPRRARCSPVISVASSVA